MRTTIKDLKFLFTKLFLASFSGMNFKCTGIQPSTAKSPITGL